MMSREDQERAAHERPLLTRFLPRSLWAQTILLLLVAVSLSAATVGPWASARFEDQFVDELQKRGSSTVKTMEKHADLRLAISLADEKQAAPILASLVASDEEVLYVGILGANKQPIAYAPASMAAADLAAHAQLHFLPVQARDEVRRFTQPVTRTREAPGGLDFAAGPDTDKAKSDLLGYVVLGLKTAHMHQRARLQVLSAIGVSALLVFTVLILFYFRWVARRLFHMVQFAQDISKGELRRRLDDPVEDDLGRLAAALRSMAERTGGVVTQLQEASRQLSGSSAEMFDASSRQAGNASKQAASVTEMGATVAELRETFNQATSKAESVIDLARRSEESSTGGAEAVKQSIDGMLHIREQVAAIAQTIDGLVQRTDQIDAIIDVVNDLAEQSNVLALNAGIEAARAGEHGRGFAVVAREVRSLAERSKESTAQVRAILQDIKLAGRDAVRAIEEGSRRAEAGSQVSQAAGDAIHRLGDAIAASSSAAMQIASSTRQQSVGVEQIWQATKEIDRIATETAQGILKIEEAAANMKKLSATMADIVGRYRIAS
jgi:methyl-accepting chemotaxis protein